MKKIRNKPNGRQEGINQTKTCVHFWTSTCNFSWLTATVKLVLAYVKGNKTSVLHGGVLCLMEGNGHLHHVDLCNGHPEQHLLLRCQLEIIPWKKSWHQHTYVVFWSQFAFCAFVYWSQNSTNNAKPGFLIIFRLIESGTWHGFI